MASSPLIVSYRSYYNIEEQPVKVHVITSYSIHYTKLYEKHNDIVVTIDPQMSFGTGEQQTTKMVINFLEKFIKQGMQVLDVGSGTGILAITALKLGASYRNNFV